MKKFCIVFIMLITTIVVGNAQFFIEGGFRVSYSDSKNTGSDIIYDLSSFSFSASPKIGYWLNDRMAVGANIFYSETIINNNTSNLNDPAQVIKSKKILPQYGFSIFGRYELYRIRRFAVLTEGDMSISIGNTKEKLESITRKTESTSSISLGVVPLISYDLTDKFSLITTCNFMRLHFHSDTSKNEVTGSKVTSDFFDFDTHSNIFNSLSDISISFSYKFR